MSNPELTQALAERVFKPIAEQLKDYTTPLAGFAAQEGSQYRDQRALMVVGRAVNGGYDKHDLRHLPDAEERQELARALGQETPAWVVDQWQCRDDYNPARSAFWRVIRRVTCSLVDGSNNRDWPNYLVWSNLYKVDPYQVPGNPPERVLRVQRSGCKDLLKLEFSTFIPKRVLFLTGWQWWAKEIVDAPREAQKPAGTRFVERVWDQPVSSDSGAPASRFVVACHPQTRPEEPWTEEVLAAFGS